MSGRLAHLEHVAETALGLDHRLLGVRVDLAPEIGDVALHDARVAVEVVLPDVIEDLRLRQHAVRVEHQVAQELELGRAQLDRRRADEDVVRVLIHGQLAGADDRLLVGLHRAAQDRLGAGDDLVEAEGLGDVVVAAGVEPLDLVLRVVLRGEEEDRSGEAGAPKALGDAEPVHVGEHDVEDDEVGLLLEDGGDGGGAVGDGLHRESGEAQPRGQQVADVRFVVDDQDARFSHAPIMVTSSMRMLDSVGSAPPRVADEAPLP
ncbi:hypothetical protein ABE10_00595 [Bacillus toyonensis]|nr:hypothetical protein [Bacillus toyonensis]